MLKDLGTFEVIDLAFNEVDSGLLDYGKTLQKKEYVIA